jgi:hypothetical protein
MFDIIPRYDIISTTTTKREEDMKRLTGIEAIEHAETKGLTLNKYTDPVEEAREGLTPEEARRIAKEDPSLIYLDVAN